MDNNAWSAAIPGVGGGKESGDISGHPTGFVLYSRNEGTRRFLKNLLGDQSYLLIVILQISGKRPKSLGCLPYPPPPSPLPRSGV